MPQITLQYSKNIKTAELSCVFGDIHALLAERLPTELITCKSRIIQVGEFFIGNGAENIGFIHLEVAVWPGRSGELLSSISKELCELLKKCFIPYNLDIEIAVSVEVRDLSDHYSKDKI